MRQQVIHIHPEAPRKPAVGQPCNGCGVCCLAEPCPAGIIVSRRLKGACKALVWSDETGRYRCGLLVSIGATEGARQGRLTRFAARLWQAWARRMISAGSGCDADIELDDGPGHPGTTPG